MRIFILFLCILITRLSVGQEATREGKKPEIRNGIRIQSIPSLRRFQPDLTRNPVPTRGLDGLKFKKKFRDQKKDFGSEGRDLHIQKNTSIKEKAVIRFNGDGAGFTTVVPADPVLAVGPGHLIQLVNGIQGSLVRVMDRTGREIVPQRYLHQLVNRPDYFGYGDPVVLYDQFTARFIIAEFGSDSCSGCYPNTLMVGMSSGSDPAGGWNFYKFSSDNMVDYPKFAAWPDILFATTNDYNSAGTEYLGTSVMAIDKRAMANGSPEVAIRSKRLQSPGIYYKFLSLAPVNISGNRLSGNASEGLFMYFHDDNRTTVGTDKDSLGLIGFQPDFNNQSPGAFRFIKQIEVSPFKSDICQGTRTCIPSAGGKYYDDLSDRLMHKIYYRSFGNHASIVLNHTVDAAYPGEPRAAIRWYELRNHGNGWEVYQQSTFSPDTDARFMGTININRAGQIGIAYNLSGPGKYASLYFTGRNPGDSLGMLTLEETLIKGGTAYGTFDNRWGDYNDMVTDITDDSTFWFTGMYGSGNWQTRISALNFPNSTGAVKFRADLVLKKINDPISRPCTNEINPSVTIANNGTDTIHSFLLFFDHGNGKDSISWNGSLLPGEEILVKDFSSISLTDGQKGIFSVYTSQPNQQQDDHPNDDSSWVSWQYSIPEEMNLEEDFEDPLRTDIRWGIEGNWSSISGNSSKGYSIRAANYLTYNSSSAGLYSPPIAVPRADSIYLSFDLAYPSIPSNRLTDTLEIILRDYCGEAIASIFKKWGPSLSTTEQPPEIYLPGDSSGFVPRESDWKNILVNITPYLQEKGIFRAEFRNGFSGGDNLYLDNIHIYPVILPERLKKNGYLVFPNPTGNHIYIRHIKDPEDLVAVEISNMQGQLLLRKSFRKNATRQFQLDMKPFSTGVYQLRLVYTDRVITERIIKSR